MNYFKNNTMKKFCYVFLVLLFTFFVSCNRTEEAVVNDITQPTNTPTGKVSGRVFAKNGLKEIGGALVFTFDDKHKLYYTYSDAQGNFSFDAPEGNRTITIQTGNGSNFRTELNVNVKKNETLVIPASDSKLNQVANMAFVKGSYDKIENIVTSLGYNITQISYNDLKNMTTISQYDIIFLNCGSRTSLNSGTATPNADTMIYDNLATFVTNGGSLYASDWDVAYLVGGNSNTNACNTTGGFIPDNLLCSTNNGSATTLANCNVTDANLAAALGFNTLNIEYDLGAWQKIVNYDANFWDVLVKYNNEALMIRTNKFQNASSPQVSVGNSSNNNFVTICHNENGNPITITINQNALQAHLAHGDSVGPCSGVNTSGNIYYTTFHNHATGNIGNTAPILQYVILHL